MSAFADIKPEDKNSFLSSSVQKALSILDMNDKEGLDLMGAKVPIKPECKNSFLSSSAQKTPSHENSILDINDKEGLNLMGISPHQARRQKFIPIEFSSEMDTAYVHLDRRDE